MNRKLFRLITLVVTVLLALAITAPALAYPPDAYDYDYEILDCDGDLVNEIWVHEHGHIKGRYLFDENGEEVEIFFHGTAHLHIYNLAHPDLFINGTSVVNHHSQKIDGSWFTGSEFNFHAPGYPQLNHSSGITWVDEDYNIIFQHGRFVVGDIQQFCELLTPP